MCPTPARAARSQRSPEVQTGSPRPWEGGPSPVGAAGARGARAAAAGSAAPVAPGPSAGGSAAGGRRTETRGGPGAGRHFPPAPEALLASGEHFGVGFRTVSSPPPPGPLPGAFGELSDLRWEVSGAEGSWRCGPGQWEKMKARNVSRAFLTQQTADPCGVSNRLIQRWSYGSARPSPPAAFSKWRQGSGQRKGVISRGGAFSELSGEL